MLAARDPDMRFTLWPWKVPIQSPFAPFLSIGKPSLLALVRKYPSGVTGLHGIVEVMSMIQLLRCAAQHC